MCVKERESRIISFYLLNSDVSTAKTNKERAYNAKTKLSMKQVSQTNENATQN